MAVPADYQVLVTLDNALVYFTGTGYKENET